MVLIRESALSGSRLFVRWFLFLLGWVPSNPKCVFGLIFILLIDWQKTKLHWHFKNPSCLVLIAPGLVNKLIFEFYWGKSTSVRVCCSVSKVQGVVVPWTLAVSNSTTFALKWKTLLQIRHTITCLFLLASIFFPTLCCCNFGIFCGKTLKIGGKCLTDCWDCIVYTCSMHFLT